MEPQRAMISFNCMPQPEQIPPLLLGESVMSLVNQLCSVPAKLVVSLALCVLVQRERGRAWPFPRSGHSTVILLYAQPSTKMSQSLSESKLSPRCTERNAKVSPNFCRHSKSPIIGSGSAATNLIYRLLFQIQQYFQHNYSSTRLNVQVLRKSLGILVSVSTSWFLCYCANCYLWRACLPTSGFTYSGNINLQKIPRCINQLNCYLWNDYIFFS